MPPQVLVGVGLALVLSALTETALHGRAPQAIHGGWTISARHAGVVIGLLALTPIFTADIAEQRHDAIDAGTAVVLDSRVAAAAEARARAADRGPARGRAGARCRRSVPPSSRCPRTPRTATRSSSCAKNCRTSSNRGATHAFSPSFGLAALLGLLALVPIGLAQESRSVSRGADEPQAACWRRDRRCRRPALVGVYLAAGGSSYAPAKTQDPCKHAPLARSGRPRADRRAVLALGARRRRLRARGEPRDAGTGAGHAGVARTLQRALRDRRRRAGAGDPRRACCGPSTTPKMPVRSAHSSPAHCAQSLRSIPLDQAIELIDDARSLLDGLQTFLGPAQKACSKNSSPEERRRLVTS